MKLTATQGGMYEVRVNGVAVSQHTSWWKAAEQAFLHERAKPADVVTVWLGQEVRVEALAEPEPAPVIAPTSSDVLFAWDATKVAPFFIHGKPGDPPRVTLVNVGGRPGVRLLTMPGDNNVNGSGDWERTDLRLGNDLSFAKEGRVVLFRHSVWFPSDFPDMPQSALNPPPWYAGSWFNFHDDRDSGGSQGPVQGMFYPPTAVSADRATGLVYQMFGGSTGGTKLSEPKLGLVVREKWYDFESRIKWTSNAAGLYETRLNGALAFSYTGPTLHAGAGAYLKLANYHTAFGEPVAIVHGAVSIEEAIP